MAIIIADNKKIELRRRVFVVSFFMLFLFLLIVYYLYNQKIQNISSDVTTMLPLIQDWISGNYLLKGWVVGTNSFFYTDTIWCIPGEMIGLDTVKIISYTGALFHAGFTVLMLFIFLFCEYEKDNEITFLRSLYCFSYILCVGTIPYSASYIYLNLNGHAGAFFAISIELLLLHFWIFSENPKNIWIFIYTILGILFAASDTIMLMVLFGPMCICSVYYLFWPNIKRNHNKLISLFFCNIAAVFCGGLFNIIIEKCGGLIIRGLPIHLVDCNEAKKRIIPFIKQIYNLFGFSENMRKTNFLYYMVVQIILLSILFSVIWQIGRAVASKPDSKSLFLALAILSNVVGCVFSDVAITGRYILSVPLFGIILIYRTYLQLFCGLLNKIKSAKIILPLIAFMIAIVFFVSNFNAFPVTSQSSIDASDMAEYLQNNNLGNGYGDFWVASFVSSYTDFDNLVIPVNSSNAGFYKYPELISTEWYNEINIHYILLYKNDINNNMCRESDVKKFMGTPDKVVVKGIYKLLYYQKDISKYLNRDTKYAQ